MSNPDKAPNKMQASDDEEDIETEPDEILFHPLSKTNHDLRLNLYKLIDDEETRTEDTIVGNWTVAPIRPLIDFHPVMDSWFPLAICGRSFKSSEKLFIDIFQKERIRFTRISDLRSANLVYSKEGWLLFRRRFPSTSCRNCLFLHNIVTGESRDLPEINRSKLGHHYAFSTLPSSSSSSVDYVVHVIRESYNRQTIIFVNRPCDGAWVMYTKKHPHKLCHDNFVAVLIFEKKVYVFDHRDEADVFDLVESCWLEISGLEEEKSTFHVTEVDGQIVKIYAPKSNLNLYKFLRLVEWDDGFYPQYKASWVEMSEIELENKTWFLGSLARRSFCVDTRGREGSSAVYRLTKYCREPGLGYNMNIRAYDLKAGAAHSVLPFPMFSSHCGWVDLRPEGNGSQFSSEMMNIDKLIVNEGNRTEDLIVRNWLIAPKRCLIDFHPVRDSGFPLLFCPRSFSRTYVESLDHVFIDIFKEEKITITNMLDLGSRELVYSKQGWLLFRRLTRSFTTGLFLHNIITGERLNLPDLDQVRFSRAHGFAFSTLCSSVDYIIYVYRDSHARLTTIFVARPHDAAWEEHTKRHEYKMRHDNYIVVIIVQKMVYLFDGSEMIDVFDLVERQWLPVTGLRGEMIGFHIREVDGNIMKIYAPDTNLNMYSFSWLVVSYDAVFAVSRASWVEMTESELENKSWFIGGVGSPTFCVKSHQGREGESNVYRLISQSVVQESGPGYAMNIQVYDLKAGTTRSVLPFPLFSHVRNRWIDLD